MTAPVIQAKKTVFISSNNISQQYFKSPNLLQNKDITFEPEMTNCRPCIVHGPFRSELFRATFAKTIKDVCMESL
jgi:hypothetical protein